LTEGFLLGLSLGAICLSYCVPILAPYLLGEGKKVIQNALDVGLFLFGRLAGYLLFGVLAWCTGKVFLQGSDWRSIIIGSAYVVFSILLGYYGFFHSGDACPAQRTGGYFQGLKPKRPFAIPLFGGFVTGLSFCPPFLLAFTGAADAGKLVGSLLFFLAFFLGTSIFFIPIPLIGFLRHFSVLKIVGKLAAGAMGIYYLYLGIILLTGTVVAHNAK